MRYLNSHQTKKLLKFQESFLSGDDGKENNGKHKMKMGKGKLLNFPSHPNSKFKIKVTKQNDDGINIKK